MLKRLARFIRTFDWPAVAIEILVIIIGLMLALQLDRWWQDQVERREEREYVDRLIADMEADIPAIEYAIELQSLRLELIDLLMEVAGNPQRALREPAVFLGAVNQSAYTYTPALTSHTFENLRATGDLGLVGSQAVKDILFEYYGFDEEQRQYRPLQFETESRHFALAAGILSPAQEVFLQDTWLFFRPDNMEEVRAKKLDTEEVLATAQRLQQRSDLVAWMPYVRSMQLEQIGVHEARLRRARDALEALHAYAGEAGGD